MKQLLLSAIKFLVITHLSFFIIYFIFNNNLEYERLIKHVKLMKSAVPEEVINEIEQRNYNTYRALTKHYKAAFAVLVFVCNKVTVTETLDNLIKYEYKFVKHEFIIIVVQNCVHRPTTDAILSYRHEEVYLIQNPHGSWPVDYYETAKDYNWAFNEIFKSLRFKMAIILKDNLIVSPDLYQYFKGLLPILEKDPSLLCVEAFNENGRRKFINEKEPNLLHRTDYFSGIAWMITEPIWSQFPLEWPAVEFTNWMRSPDRMQQRACIRPEVSRVCINVSQNYLTTTKDDVVLNNIYTRFPELDLTYLFKANYDYVFIMKAYHSPLIDYTKIVNDIVNDKEDVKHKGRSVRIHYSDRGFDKIAKSFGLMNREEYGIPCNSYRGVINFYYKGKRVYLMPAEII